MEPTFLDDEIDLEEAEDYYKSIEQKRNEEKVNHETNCTGFY